MRTLARAMVAQSEQAFLALAQDEGPTVPAVKILASRIFDLLCGGKLPQIYAGELEVRPPGAPTTNPSAAREPPRARHPRGEAAARNRKGLVDRLRIREGQC